MRVEPEGEGRRGALVSRARERARLVFIYARLDSV